MGRRPPRRAARRRHALSPLLLVVAAIALLGGAAALGTVLVRQAGHSAQGSSSHGSYRSTLGARVERFDLDSTLTRRRLRGVAIIPAMAPGTTAPRPLLLLLHGRDMRPDFFLTDALFRAIERAGAAAPVVVALDGGRSSYWHDRADGRWGSMVVREAIPAAARRLSADPRRVAVGGISMGGFGALDLARRHPGRFCAAGARSPAIFPSSRSTAPGAFDDAADFRRHDLLRLVRGRRPFGATRVWIDRGDADPFRAATDRLARLVPAATVRRWAGAHDAAYWRGHEAAFDAWMVQALQRCGG